MDDLLIALKGAGREYRVLLRWFDKPDFFYEIVPPEIIAEVTHTTVEQVCMEYKMMQDKGFYELFYSKIAGEDK